MTISYDCSQCPAKFKKTSYLQEHIQNIHKKYRDSFLYDCTFCYAKFSKNCHLIEHIGNVHPEKETGIILAEKIEQCHFCKLEEKIDDKGENDVPVENGISDYISLSTIVIGRTSPDYNNIIIEIKDPYFLEPLISLFRNTTLCSRYIVMVA